MSIIYLYGKTHFAGLPAEPSGKPKLCDLQKPHCWYGYILVPFSSWEILTIFFVNPEREAATLALLRQFVLFEIARNHWFLLYFVLWQTRGSVLSWLNI